MKAVHRENNVPQKNKKIGKSALAAKKAHSTQKTM
jgi:hypothetical protein